MINPTLRPGMTEEVVRLMPEGMGMIPLFLNIHRGTTEEFETVMDAYEEKVAELAEQEVDLIHPNGAPPFMVQGFAEEKKIIARWTKKHNIPIFTSGTNHVRALKALKVKKFVGATYFSGDINNTFAKYFTDAGFDVLANLHKRR